MALRRAKPLLGTLVEIAATSPFSGASGQALDVGAQQVKLQAAITAAFSRVEDISRLLSFHKQESELNQLNASPGIWCHLSSDSLRVLRLAKYLGRASDNLFNCTVGGELIARGALPSPLGMPLLSQGHWQDIEIEANCARILRPIMLTLDGIAKGYAVDMAVSVLRRHGITGGWVNAGGDLKVFGTASLNVICRDTNGLSKSIKISNSALASSRVSSSLSQDFPALLLPTGDIDISANSDDERIVSIQAPFAWRADALTKVAGYLSSENAKVKISQLGGELVSFSPKG
ncbi:FAD:protein FMN transferase [Shewanella sp. A25]|nr:FAD:protein FMN transferase [Shewanella shenzhenensis]